MALFPAKFYQFKKRTNSTERPSESALLHTCNVALKAGTSILTPTLEIANGGNVSNILKVNYCYIAKFSRYYFVTDISYDRGIWYISLNVDVLATYKDEIGAESRFILRCSATCDGTIADNRGRIVTNYYTETSNKLSFINQFINGTVVIGISNKEETGLHGSYYAMTYNEYLNLRAILFSEDWLTQLADIGQYIHYCKWFPIQCSSETLPVYTTKVSRIPLYRGYVDVSAYQISLNPIVEISSTFSVPKPVAISKGTDEVDPLWLCRSPYANYTLIFPGFGEMQLNPDMICYASNLFCKVQIDISTGSALLNVSTSSTFSSLVCKNSASFGVELPVVGVDYKQRQALSGLLTIGGALGQVAAKDYGGAISSTLNGAVQTLESCAPGAQRHGNAGSIVEFKNQAFVQGVFQLLTIPNINNDGLPLYEMRKPSTIPGYIECGAGYTRISGTADEYNKVNQYMREGFYYA